MTPTEQLLQQIVDSNREIVDQLQQLRGAVTSGRSSPDAPSPAPDNDTSNDRPPTKTPRPHKGREVRGT